MALRMSQMLRFSRETPQADSVAAVGARIPSEGSPDVIAGPGPEAAAPPRPPANFETLEAAGMPAPGATVEHVSDPSDPAVGVYEQLLSVVQLVFDAAATGSAPDGPATVAPMRAVLEQLEQGDGLLAVTVRQRGRADSLAKRSANVAVLSILLGLEMKYDERQCVALGLCCIMHDIGMLTIPADAMNARKFSNKVKGMLHRHPIESKRMVESFGKAFNWVGEIVVQAHERWDGGGYPQGLKKEEIHEFARVIGLVDTYEAMVQPRADREARVVYNALQAIIDQRNTQFEPRLIKALISIVSIFPVGSLVKVNNGEIGRVVGAHRRHPTRPAVDILVDSHGRRLDEARTLKLVDEPMLYIVDPAIGETAIPDKTG